MISAWITDMFAEASGVRASLDRLGSFMNSERFDKLDRAEQFRLVRQQQAMRLYYDVLNERISAASNALRGPAGTAR